MMRKEKSGWQAGRKNGLTLSLHTALTMDLYCKHLKKANFRMKLALNALVLDGHKLLQSQTSLCFWDRSTLQLCNNKIKNQRSVKFCVVKSEIGRGFHFLQSCSPFRLFFFPYGIRNPSCLRKASILRKCHLYSAKILVEQCAFWAKSRVRRVFL